MANALAAAASAFALVAVQEFADKTQLVLLALAARGRLLPMWAGASAAFLLLTAAAAAAGAVVGAVVPEWAARVVAGAVFVGFGVWTLVHSDAEEMQVPVREAGFAAAFFLILVAELGDKTQLAVAALAAETGEPVAVGVGGWLALVSLIPLAAGPWLLRRVPIKKAESTGAWIFIAVGVFLLASVWWT
jgi:putative Ca2+/H+ antiporter (TMEM165/GDT1 family)